MCNLVSEQVSAQLSELKRANERVSTLEPSDLLLVAKLHTLSSRHETWKFQLNSRLERARIVQWMEVMQKASELVPVYMKVGDPR